MDKDEHITETAENYYIPTGDGQILFQRKYPLTPCCNPMSSSEKVIVRLCEKLINTNKLINKLDEKYGFITKEQTKTPGELK